MKSNIDRTYITNTLFYIHLLPKINKLNIIMKFYIISTRTVEKALLIQCLLNVSIKLYTHLNNYKY